MIRNIGTFLAAAVVLCSCLAWAAPVTPAARSVIPFDARQIISIDYRIAKSFDTAVTLKAEALPANFRDFERTLKAVGVYANRDVDAFTFASFDGLKQTEDVVGVASGTFSSMGVRTQLALARVKPSNYGGTEIYSISKTMSLALLDDHALLLGTVSAVKAAINVRSGQVPSLEKNQEALKTIETVEKSTVWSVLDRIAAQKMLSLAVGDPVKMPGFGQIKDQVLGARYTINFRDGIRFTVDVFTPDTVSATKLSGLLKLGLLYKKIATNPAQHLALDDLKVSSKQLLPDSTRSELRMRFTVDLREFQALLQSRCFGQLWSERRELSGLTAEQIPDSGKQPERASSISE